MRAILEVLRDFRHPVTIVTKGALIQRDIDILAEMASLHASPASRCVGDDSSTAAWRG